MNKVLEIKHCNKSFGENEVLKDISLSVTEGQVVSIIGPSGSGKSTLLRCATMLETMDGGESFESEFNRITLLLAMIPEEQAEVIRLRTIGGLQFGDIAQMTGLPESTVKSRFKYGIEKVRKLLDLKMPESH